MKARALICSLALSVAAVPAIGAFPRLSATTDELRPWHLVHARVVDDVPIEDRIAVIGTTWEGDRRLLFETDDAPGMSSFEIAFWLDDGIKSVALERGIGDEAEAGPSLAVAADRSSDLPELPFHAAMAGYPPGGFTVPSADLSSAGRAAAADLFVSPSPSLSVLILLALLPAVAGLSALASRLPRNRGDRGAKRSGRPMATALASGLALSILAAALAISALPPSKELFVVGFEGSGAGVKAGELVISERGGWHVLEWGKGPLRLLGARLLPGRRLPLDLVEEGGTTVLAAAFSPVPVVVRSADGDGGDALYLEADGFLTGWLRHE